MHKAWKKTTLVAVGFFVVFAVMTLLFWHSTTNSWQAAPALVLDVYFEGEYRIGGGEWKPVVEGQHISSTQGDVTLKGQFHMLAPDGEYVGVAGEGTPLAIYIDHINVTIQEQEREPWEMDIESDYAGAGFCGVYCDCYTIQTQAPITLTFHNNHRLGNENAIDEFLQQLAVYNDTSFEKEFMVQGETERNAGLAFVIVGFVLLGTAVFSTLLHIEGSGKLWLIGLCIFFAGGYFIYGSMGVSFWSDSIIGNTTILGGCMMLYMLCLCALITSTFESKLRRFGIIATIFLGAVCVVLAVVCIATDVRFYDTWLWWAILQSVVNIALIVCLILGVLGAPKGKIVNNIGAIVLLVGFEADVVGVALGGWQGGFVCKCAFVLLFLISMVLVWQIVPRNINAARRAKEMEAEQKEIRAQLQENRIAIMISQIQPHFIYNTLGTIQYLCKENPEKAAQLVQNFSMYLRGNFSELDNTVPIRFLKELEHVRCYTDIELVRFPDMTVQYDIQADAFLLPALSVQPLVENAIKHGLMGLEEGGTVTVATFETETHYCVKVTDNGVGFDETCLQDKRKHVGIRNVRERLQVMCGGTLTVESQKGKGTTALIQIPKEGNKV